MLSSVAQWAIAVTGVAVALWLLNKFRWLRDVLLPMWMPLSVTILAAFALLWTDQGRDLGAGLLGNGRSQLLILALALFYWAMGSWNAARLCLNCQFGTDRQQWSVRYDLWLRWLPRLLGACAYLIAAASLACAARHDIEPAVGWLLFLPPILIVIGTGIVCGLDRTYEARNRRPQWQESHDQANIWWCLANLFLLGAAALVVLVLLWVFRKDLPEGFIPATVAMLGSAALFLLFVSFREVIERWFLALTSDRLAYWFDENGPERDADENRPECSAGHLAGAQRHVKVAPASFAWTGILSLCAVLFVALAWRNPVEFDEWGSMAVGVLAFGAYIAVIDLLRMGSEALQPRWPGVTLGSIGVLLLLLVAGNSLVRDFHPVRLCGDALAPCTASATEDSASDAKADAWTDSRPTVAEAADAWYKQASKGRAPDSGPVPMLVIATAGGGIRAAYWTATVLERLEQDLGPDVLRRHLFAISGVSGGSLGAAMYIASVLNSLDRKEDDLAKTEVAEQAKATAFLDHDFLAPAIGTLAFIDIPSSVLPDLGQGNRAYALERAWEVASAEVLAHPFLSLFPSKQELKGGNSWRPALLLNATHQESGRRVITSHFKIERHVFLDSFDAHDLLKADMPASTAAHNSARFMYISPAGKLISRPWKDDPAQSRGFLLDGGYFENFGAVTALQLVREARRAIGPANVRPIILQISSDPSLASHPRPVPAWTRRFALQDV